MTANVIDFETAAAERSIRASRAAIMRDVMTLPDCHERDLLLAIGRGDYADLARLNAMSESEQKIGFDDWKAAQ